MLAPAVLLLLSAASLMMKVKKTWASVIGAGLLLLTFVPIDSVLGYFLPFWFPVKTYVNVILYKTVFVSIVMYIGLVLLSIGVMMLVGAYSKEWKREGEVG